MADQRKILSTESFFEWFEQHFQIEATCQKDVCLKNKYEEKKQELLVNHRNELIDAYEDGTENEYQYHIKDLPRKTADQYLNEKYQPPKK